VILKTDKTPARNTDHIRCYRDAGGELGCNYEAVLIE
jgi:hypothetical protein